MSVVPNSALTKNLVTQKCSNRNFKFVRPSQAFARHDHFFSCFGAAQEKCTNKICAKWVLCFAGCCFPSLGHVATWIGPCRSMTSFIIGPMLFCSSPCPYGIVVFFRILLLRGLRLQFPLFTGSCGCRCPPDPLADHRAACAQAGDARAKEGPVWKGRSTHRQRRRNKNDHKYPTHWSQSQSQSQSLLARRQPL